MGEQKKRGRLRRILLYLSSALLALVAFALVWVFYCFRDRNPGYRVDLNIDGTSTGEATKQLRVGFGRVNITPNLLNEERTIWLGGFGNGREATAIHDDLWALACVLDDGATRLGIVALDAIGFMHDDVLAVRRRLLAEWKLDYTILCSTHNHSTPDLIGIWGPKLFRSGVEPRYREEVTEATAKALGEAVAVLQPARMALHEIPTRPTGLVNDTRLPEVFDPDIRLMLFTNPTNNETLGSIVTWANHPETPWSGNTEITADFPGYLREALEKGVRHEGKSLLEGLGGIHLYINGAVGGLMSPNPSLVVKDPFLDQSFSKPSHEKARALGRNLAQRIVQRLRATNSPPQQETRISIFARTIELPLENPNFLLAPLLGVIDRGQVRWKTIRSEVALVTVGEASIACIPGEIYPEIVNGGIVKAPGGDFDTEALEIPPLRELMPGKVKFIFGLANDEIGYIIPKSEWDEKPPYLFNAHKPVYGEINSLGPSTASSIHTAIKGLIEYQTATGRLRGAPRRD